MLALVLVAALGNKGDQIGKTGDQAECSERSADQDCESTLQRMARTLVPVVADTEAPPRKPYPERDEWRAEQEIKALGDQVLWAGWAAAAGWAAVVVGAIGILFVKRTLDATRDAVIQAAKAAAAAEKAVADASETAQRQLRAYISVESVALEVFEVGKPVMIRVKAINSGQTPANNTKMMVTIASVPLPQTAPLTHTAGEHDSNASIGPGVYIEVAALLRPAAEKPPTILTQQDVTDLQEGRVALIGFGFISYEDVFGRRQTTNLKFQTLTAECREGRYVLVASNDGNDAT